MRECPPLALLALALSCAPSVLTDETRPAGNGGNGGNGALSGGGGSGAGASGSPSAGGASAGSNGGQGSSSAGGGPITATSYLPARIRRLTNSEYDLSVQALLGTTKQPSAEFSFPPDARQGPTNSPAGAAFSVNDAQRVDPLLAGKLDAAAEALVTEARANGKLAALAPCTDLSATGAEACAADFLRRFGAKAFRRPVTDAEVATLVSKLGSAYHVGADGYTYADGVDVLTRVILQTPAFLYVTELGNGASGALFELTPNEVASSLSYILTGSPPDDPLLAKAAAGALATPDGRESEARRLLATTTGKARLVRVVEEWLGIQEVARREKAQSVYPDFANVAPAMERESRAFIEEVLFNSSGTVSELLSADWTIVEAPLAAVYGVTPAAAGQRTSLASVRRRGILNQGAFRIGVRDQQRKPPRIQRGRADAPARVPRNAGSWRAGDCSELPCLGRQQDDVCAVRGTRVGPRLRHLSQNHRWIRVHAGELRRHGQDEKHRKRASRQLVVNYRRRR
ncbi:MAG: DUF1592 domain-containing protein [Polyangiaceae bacterium]